jgi:hypothetical protein
MYVRHYPSASTVCSVTLLPSKTRQWSAHSTLFLHCLYYANFVILYCTSQPKFPYTSTDYSPARSLGLAGLLGTDGVLASISVSSSLIKWPSPFSTPLPRSYLADTGAEAVRAWPSHLVSVDGQSVPQTPVRARALRYKLHRPSH